MRLQNMQLYQVLVVQVHSQAHLDGLRRETLALYRLCGSLAPAPVPSWRNQRPRREQGEASPNLQPRHQRPWSACQLAGETRPRLFTQKEPPSSLFPLLQFLLGPPNSHKAPSPPLTGPKLTTDINHSLLPGLVCFFASAGVSTRGSSGSLDLKALSDGDSCRQLAIVGRLGIAASEGSGGCETSSRMLLRPTILSVLDRYAASAGSANRVELPTQSAPLQESSYPQRALARAERYPCRPPSRTASGAKSGVWPVPAAPEPDDQVVPSRALLASEGDVTASVAWVGEDPRTEPLDSDFVRPGFRRKISPNVDDGVRADLRSLSVAEDAYLSAAPRRAEEEASQAVLLRR